MTKRYKTYIEELTALYEDISFGQYYSAISAKLMNYISHNPFADINEIQAYLSSIFPAGFEKYVESIITEYDHVVDLVNSVYGKLGLDVQRDFEKIRAIEKVNEAYLGKYSVATQNNIVKVVRTGLADKLSRKELAQRLDYLGGKVTGYSQTIANTQIKTYGRILKIEKAKIGDVIYFDYVGLIRDTTRDFCLSMLEQSQSGKRWTLEELDTLDNGPKQLKPVSQYCGGWNCHHDTEPDPFYED